MGRLALGTLIAFTIVISTTIAGIGMWAFIRAFQDPVVEKNGCISPGKLYEQWKSNYAVFSQKKEGTTVCVRAKVESITALYNEKSCKEEASIVFACGWTGSIRCFFSDPNSISQIQAGDKISVGGAIHCEKDRRLTLLDCYLIEP